MSMTVKQNTTKPVDDRYKSNENLLLQIDRKKTESTEHIITKLARFHIEFESIHPFIDGNGRTGFSNKKELCFRGEII